MVEVSYHTLDGQIRSAGSDHAGNIHMLRDGLGSVIQTFNFLNSVALSQRYAPHGTPVVQSNGQPQFSTDMRMGWGGTWGYRSTSMKNSEIYVRARHYSYSSGMWATRDPLWPSHQPFVYANNTPLLDIDPTGLAACTPKPCVPAATTKTLETPKCDISKQQGKDIWNILAYKCQVSTCTSVGTEGACGFTQFYSGIEIANGSTTLYEYQQDGNQTTSFNCPGQGELDDAPGFGTRRPAGSPCSVKKPLTYTGEELNKILPFILALYFEDVCTCGNSSSAVPWSLNIIITKPHSPDETPPCSIA